MKKRSKAAWPCPIVPNGSYFKGLAPTVCAIPRNETFNGFMRGFIATGLLAATQQSPARRKQILRLALQGGAAMATGIAGASALERRDWGQALVAIAAGAAGLKLINTLNADPVIPDVHPKISDIDKD